MSPSYGVVKVSALIDELAAVEGEDRPDVWIDALSNYITALGYGSDNDSKFKQLWLENSDQLYHVIGKDILRFHAIYWPIMLMALNIPINFKLYVHGWIFMKEGKMSKYVGNIVYPMDVVNEYGLDALRYYLVKEMPLGNDGLFSWDIFIERYNVELANDLGNLVSRSISMINKYFDSKVTKPTKQYFEFDKEFENVIKEAVVKTQENFDNFEFQNGLNELWSIVRRANKYIDETAPWVLAKDENKKEELNSVMYHLYEAIRLVAILVNPVMPDASSVILEELGVEETQRTFVNLQYGITEFATVTKTPVVLFKRLDVQKELAKHE